ncbi:MAG: 30S ribosome-binding factor RbfA [Clostridia bacterium]|nr:30S ribosome-binding factor RbfA [Clostridia bacterium]
MKEKREKRLNSEMQKLIYEILTTKIKNPYITEMFSVTDVSVTSDLETADVYISVYSTNADRKKATFEAIFASSSQVRYELGKLMRIRYIPELRFKMDNSSEYGEKIDKIISGFTYGDNDDENGNR